MYNRTSYPAVRSVRHRSQMYEVHRESVEQRGVMEYFHISKTGGTSWNAAAREFRLCGDERQRIIGQCTCWQEHLGADDCGGGQSSCCTRVCRPDLNGCVETNSCKGGNRGCHVRGFGDECRWVNNTAFAEASGGLRLL